ncbi:MAG: (2Fe-2S)-binding protein [Xanthomonadaceae bacterium]|jgi:bacterioferritin-associated ferredoxin|nr:(2Fe-2S)-binding protein [Xanthomonadaceae bacterium]
MYVCLCNAVTDRAIREAAARGIDTMDALAAETGVGACCGACRPLALQILDEAQASSRGFHGAIAAA